MKFAKQVQRHGCHVFAGAALLAITPALYAQGPSATVLINSTAVNAPNCFEKGNMTTTDQLQQLSPAKTPVEFLQLLRKLHDNFLLLDAGFIEDANLLRLFEPGAVKQSWPYGKQSKSVFKSLVADPSSSILGSLPIQFMATGTKNVFFGSLTVGANTPTPLNPYTSDLIEQYLVPDVKGSNPLAPGNFSPSNENIEASIRQSRATHSKGNFQYQSVNETALCRSNVSVRLEKDGTVWDINLSQEVKEK